MGNSPSVFYQTEKKTSLRYDVSKYSESAKHCVYEHVFK